MLDLYMKNEEENKNNSVSIIYGNSKQQTLLKDNDKT